jgi:hypothetical protein
MDNVRFLFSFPLFSILHEHYLSFTIYTLLSVRIPRLEGEVESLSGLHKQKFVLQRENQAIKSNISGLEKQLVSFGERHDYPRKTARLIW